MVPWKERIAYGLGDTASNLIYMVPTMFLMYFYTDVFGLAAGTIAILFIVGKIWDAINDPIMGLIADRTHTKWGSYRPYLLWMAIPSGVFAVLLFTTPSFGGIWKVVFAFIAYIGFDMTYTAVNLPYAAMLPSLTDNYKERTTVSAIRMFMSKVGSLIVSATTLALVAKLGNGNEKSGFFYTMLIFASIAVVMYLLSFAGTKERITQPETKVKLSDSLKTIKGNTPWVVLFIVNIALWVSVSLITSMAVYFFKYNVGNPALSSVFMPVMMISMMISFIILPLLAKKFNKKSIYVIGVTIYLIGLLWMLLFVKATSLIILGAAIVGLGIGATSAVTQSMLADTVDYGEWKSGLRAQGFLFSAASFAIKFGQGIGGALGSWLLQKGGYVANAKQTASALNAIQFNFIIIPAAMAVIMMIFIAFGYKLDNNYGKVKEELEIRRKADITVA